MEDGLGWVGSQTEDESVGDGRVTLSTHVGKCRRVVGTKAYLDFILYLILHSRFSQFYSIV